MNKRLYRHTSKRLAQVARDWHLAHLNPALDRPTLTPEQELTDLERLFIGVFDEVDAFEKIRRD